MSPTPLVSSSLSLVLAASVCACVGREVAEVEPAQSREQQDVIATEINRDLDLLFVIDNSGSMGEEQASLALNFERFIQVLQNVPGGLPNVHIGVVSTDLGAGGFAIAGCEGDGDGGRMQDTPRIAGCSPASDAFIRDIGLEDGARSRNYSGGLDEAFSCVARLGTGGCGFEQPLESMRRALDGTNPGNAEFLREGARLGIVFVTDEDDCSATDGSLFDTSQTSVDDLLGPLSSFRCFELGVRCDPDAPRVAGAKSDCVPREDSAYVRAVNEYVAFLRGLKDDPRDVMVAGIIGNPTPVIVGTDGMDAPALAPSCSSAAGEASPAVRMQAMLDAFPLTSTVTTICNDDLSDALTQIAREFAAQFEPCLDGALADLDPEAAGVQPECVVSEIGPDGVEDRLPACDASASSLPCYELREDPACVDTPTQLYLEIHRSGASVPAKTLVVARCVAN